MWAFHTASFRRVQDEFGPDIRGEHTPGPQRADTGWVCEKPSLAYVPNDLLGRLVGFRLYSVEFVMDYVQFRFDGPRSEDMPVLNCDVMPIVEQGDRRVVEEELGYADAVRSLIPGVVRRTREETGSGLRIEFNDGAIVLNPAFDALVGPEIAVLQGFEDGEWMCWRPGEESFEHLA
jgi:hypothetical protein